MRKKGFTSIRPGLVLRGKIMLSLLCSCSAFMLSASGEKEAAPVEANVRDAAFKNQIDPLIRQAVDLRDRGDFSAALKKCREAQALIAKVNLGNGPNAIGIKQFVDGISTDISKRWGMKYMREAKTLVLQIEQNAYSKPEKAAELLNTASNLLVEAKNNVPSCAPEADRFMNQLKKYKKSLAFAKETSLNYLDPDNAARKETNAVLLREASIFYKNQQYLKARQKLEEVLTHDPYNINAISILRKVYRKLNSIAELRRENEILERMNELEWKWNQAAPPQGEQIVNEKGPQEVTSEGKAQIYNKLQSIVIPEVDFEGTEVNSAIRQISRRSKECDSENKGINFTYSPSAADSGKTVNMKLSNVPVGELIRYLCQATGLKYKVEDKAVMIGSIGIDAMDTRYFKMRAALYNRLSNETDAGAKEAHKAAASTEGDAFENMFKKSVKDTFTAGSEARKVSTAGSEALKGYFGARGISFEPGSSIVYDRRASKLIVKNTPENLRRLDALLREIDIVTPLVLIEAKMVEIRISDLEELGFDWTLTHNNSNPKWLQGANELGTQALNSYLNRNVASLQDSGTSNTSTAADLLVNNMNVFPNFGPDGAYNVFLNVRAIDQSGRGEILSAPKIIATSGQTATIQLAQDQYFPESWNDPEVTVSNNTYQYNPAYPEFGDAKPIGTTFTVTPTVSPNNHTITLDLKPKILNLTGWTEYPYTIVIGKTEYGGNTSQATPKLIMPEISVREIDTQVKVYDGETIVLGGILDETSLQIDDKYPILGEIPLLGRLFSTQAKNSEKKNLLIFVTTRMMSLDGVPVKPRTDTGLFDFNR